ncbi:silent information regulator protein Sir2p [Saccharata proteae CBS 121410]|uniref:Silent information regulator protein Sir2p n=1 Tax=Saccharata proteae CBS 121410 TaxID=1314787 RepID=A0A9P4I4Q5_9PEZI|nr:silent information regulator protein Sir2p [Saccharata proteae CBS 121410]
MATSAIPAGDLESFQRHLQSSDRILALLGAGLSASSGLPTFRGAGGLWRSHDAMSLATPEAFDAAPGLVWQFYSYRRHMALKAQPNPAHFALAELARKKEGFMTLSQNVDGLSQRAGHPPSQLQLLHGSLFDVKCSSFFCDYKQAENYADPIVPALAIPTADELSSPSSTSPRNGTTAPSSTLPNHQQEPQQHELDISDPTTPLPDLSHSHLPHCPKCTTGLLRPGVVWFNELLPRDTLETIESWIDSSERIDLILVIGTSSKVYPAAGYVDRARAKGARVAVINVERTDVVAEGDWFFQGDAGRVVPEVLRVEYGDVEFLVE